MAILIPAKVVSCAVLAAIAIAAATGFGTVCSICNEATAICAPVEIITLDIAIILSNANNEICNADPLSAKAAIEFTRPNNESTVALFISSSNCNLSSLSCFSLSLISFKLSAVSLNISTSSSLLSRILSKRDSRSSSSSSSSVNGVNI